VAVPPERVGRWFENFASRHGDLALTVHQGRLRSLAGDGAVAEAGLPFGRAYDGQADVATFADAATTPLTWGILLVRKGGFAVAASMAPR
jgi:hypothetical protein